MSPIPEKDKPPEKVEVTLVEKPPEQIVEIVPGGIAEEKERAHYWGIGINIDNENYKGNLAYIVTQVHSGYTAEFVLQPKDVIILLDDQPISFTNEIRGEGPRRMKLTIIRNGSIIYVYIERCKVYY